MEKTKDKSEPSKQEESKKREKICGIIMPISPTLDYSQQHWINVKEFLYEAVTEIDFTPNLVSDDPAIGLIHERIVTNIYNNEIVICDVSSKNPNVMFELGLRLAFDKPTIIIKDEKTNYSFDIGVVEHLDYPSSLTYYEIIQFKKKLQEKIIATHKKSVEEPNFSPFLKSFGKTIVPSSIKNQPIPESQFILEQLNNLTMEIRMLKQNSNLNDENKIIGRRTRPSLETMISIIDSYFKENGIEFSDIRTNEIIEYVGIQLAKNNPNFKIYFDDLNDALRVKKFRIMNNVINSKLMDEEKQ